jgi:Xaa-Pro aminopeptidase
MFLYSAAAVTRNGDVTLSIAELEEPDAERSGLWYQIRDSKKKYAECLPELLGKNVKVVGINASLIPYGVANVIESTGRGLWDVSEQLMTARTRKTEEELSAMRKACRIVSEVATKIPGYIRPEMREIELAGILEHEMRMHGSQGLAFETIVGSGINSANPHYTAGSRKFKKGDLVVCDFGCVVDGMHSDITRTFVIEKASDFQNRMYEAVLHAQKRALTELKVGEDGQNLWTTAYTLVRNFFGEEGVAGKMGHGLGHGIGYFTHDGPRLGQIPYRIPAGLITTVEPGAYSPKYGGVRIEDDVLVTESGIKMLTRAPKDRLIVVSGRR